MKSTKMRLEQMLTKKNAQKEKKHHVLPFFVSLLLLEDFFIFS